MDILSLKWMSEAIKSLKGHNQLRTSPKPHLWFSLSKVFWNLSKAVQEIWFRGSDPTDDFEGVLVAAGGTMEGSSGQPKALPLTCTLPRPPAWPVVHTGNCWLRPSKPSKVMQVFHSCEPTATDTSVPITFGSVWQLFRKPGVTQQSPSWGQLEAAGLGSTSSKLMREATQAVSSDRAVAVAMGRNWDSAVLVWPEIRSKHMQMMLMLTVCVVT